MRLINTTNKFIFALAWLSIVVHVTDSCSSFNGWRANNNKKRDHTDNKSTKTSSTTLPPPPIADQPCASHLDRELCQNGGRCVMRLEPLCICSKGWTGIRCMEKVTDGNYNVKINQTQESSTISASTETNMTERPDLHLELVDFRASECPSPWKEDFCLNGGICRSLNHGFGFICHCIYPFAGERCSEKALDGIYSGISRPTRDLSLGKMI